MKKSKKKTSMPIPMSLVFWGMVVFFAVRVAIA